MKTEMYQNKYALALGYFDGLHTAHGEVLKNTLALSAEGFIPSVMLFDEHPRKVLSGNSVPFLLSKEKRNEKLENAGFKIFSESFSSLCNLSPEEFIRDIVIGKIGAGALVSGYNYRFGKNGSGDSSVLQQLCEKYGLKAVICPPAMYKDAPVSSTRIRNAIENGDIAEANVMLGFEFGFSAPVFSGDKRGRLLGAPTINQYLPEGLTVPAYGVYASKVFFGGREYFGVTNIGSRPTFGISTVRSETYIIDFEGDMYGKEVEITLCEFIRPEKRFSDASELKKQIAEDVKQTEKYFSKKLKNIKKSVDK